MTAAPLPGSGGLNGRSRRYAIAFHDVWVTSLEVLKGLRGWEVTAADPRAGTIYVMTLNLFGRAPAAAEIRMSLDEVGMTVLEFNLGADESSDSPSGAVRRAERFLRRVDRALASTHGR